MLMVTSAVSILLVVLHARIARHFRPGRLVPMFFGASGLLFIAEWLFRGRAPSTAAVVIYLHVSAAGPLLASGFWLIATERFDPRAARKRFGQIAAAGTAGGFLSALVAERVAALFGAPAVLLVLAALQFLCAGLVWALAADADTGRPADPTVAGLAAAVSTTDLARSRSAFLTILETPYLRHLAALVLFGTTSAALVDYLFKAQAVATFGRGDHLLRFFALYYAATSLLTFVLQTSSSRAILDRFGIGVTTSTPSWALLAGSLGSLISPSFGSLVVARGGESVLRSSWFRAGYELFFTPIPAAEKRAAKSLIDVGFDRLGDAVGGGLVRIVTLGAPALQSPAILSLAMCCSAVAVFAASRLNRGYLGTLANNLIKRGLPAGQAPIRQHRTTKAMGRVMRSIHHRAVNRHAADAKVSHRTTTSVMRSLLTRHGLNDAPDDATRAVAGPRVDRVPMVTGNAVLDAELRDIINLRSRDRERVTEVLSRAEGLSPTLIPHVIPLLAWDVVANHAMFALQKVAEERIGQLEDALLDPNQDFAVRRRLARVFSIGVSARAAAGALLGLDDARFDVRFQSARSLTSILEKNPRIDVDRQRIFNVVLREVAVSRPVWESRRLLDGVASQSPLDAFVRDRAGESLAHVFTLLSLVMPREPLQIAFRSLQTDDEHLRGTALEYLEGVLPPEIRERLWPFLEVTPARRTSRPRQEVIAELLRSNHSVVLNLEELRRRSPEATAESAG